MKTEEYCQYDATGLARLIRSREVSAGEVVEAAIQQIEKLNPALNAVISTDFEVARESIARADPESVFFGVPYLVKDLNTWVGGLPSTNGSRAFADFVPPDDSILVERMRKAGLIILGKTNTPEFGLNMCTSPILFGPTRNPYDHELSAGGSSGGAASAVAAGILPAAHATDSGGSIRIPASNCGLFGLKPSRARVPLGNNQPEGLAGFSTAHAVTHSVRDSALLLDQTAGPVPGDVYSAPAVTDSFLNAITKPPATLKFGLWVEGFCGESIHTDCKEAAIQAAKLCESAGYTVESARPAVDGQALRHAFDVLFTANINTVVSAIEQANPDTDIQTLVEPATLACSISASRFSANDYARAVQTTQAAARALGEFFEEFDILLTPTLSNPPLPIDDVSMTTENWSDYLNQLLDEIPFTPLFNATGAPAASIPLGKSQNGAPIGIQIGAKYGAESTILQLARVLEQIAPWHQKI